MKLLEFRDFNPALAEASNFCPSLMFTTDSSISSGRRPVFLPDLSERWDMEISLAYRIGRLGKTISPRFAHRYYDAMTLCCRLLPLDLMEQMEEQHEKYNPMITAFDGAVSIGRWVEPAKTADIELISPTPAQSATVTASIDEAVSILSRCFTVKTGDIIIPGSVIFRRPVKINTHVSASLNNQEVLTFNIK